MSRHLLQDGRLVPGAGASEVELARQIAQFAETCPGLDQYAIQRFAQVKILHLLSKLINLTFKTCSQALETFPRILADNAGLKTTEMVAELIAAHQNNKPNSGIAVDVSSTSYYCSL